MKFLFTVFVILLVLKLVGITQIAWWMVFVPLILAVLLVFFIGFMVSGYGILLTVWMMERGQAAAKRKAAKQ